MKDLIFIRYLEKFSLIGMFFIFFLGIIGFLNGCGDPYEHEKKATQCECRCECKKDTITNKHCSK